MVPQESLYSCVEEWSQLIMDTYDQLRNDTNVRSSYGMESQTNTSPKKDASGRRESTMLVLPN